MFSSISFHFYFGECLVFTKWQTPKMEEEKRKISKNECICYAYFFRFRNRQFNLAFNIWKKKTGINLWFWPFVITIIWIFYFCRRINKQNTFWKLLQNSIVFSNYWKWHPFLSNKLFSSAVSRLQPSAFLKDLLTLGGYGKLPLINFGFRKPL